MIFKSFLSGFRSTVVYHCSMRFVSAKIMGHKVNACILELISLIVNVQ